MVVEYWQEFVTIAVVHLLAVASPGPDFAVVVKQSIQYGRRAAVYTSLGIGAGITIHVAYSVLGIGVMMKTTPIIYQSFLLLAAAYLCYLAYGGLTSQPAPANVNVDQNSVVSISDKAAFWRGFLTNGLNPKCTLFFLSVFAVVVSAETPVEMKLLYGGFMMLSTALWFCFVSYFLTQAKLRNKILSQGVWFDRIMGLVLIALAVRLVAELF